MLLRGAELLFDNEVPRRIVYPEGIISPSEHPLRLCRVQDITLLLNLKWDINPEHEPLDTEPRYLKRLQVIECQILYVVLSV